MKQKDKKQSVKFSGRMKNISLPDFDILDEIGPDNEFKIAAPQKKDTFTTNGTCFWKEDA